MKLKNIGFICTVILLVFTIVVYTACRRDKCKDTNCLNGGNCVSGTCYCADGFSGTNCEIKSPCKGVVCFNGGTCQSGKCACPDGYSGDSCQLEIRSVYYKIYVGDGTDDNGSQYKDFTMRIASGGTDLKKLKAIMWEAGRTGGDTLEFILDLKTDGFFDIAPQVSKNGTIIFSGNGMLATDNANLKLVAAIQAPPYDTVTMNFPRMTPR